MSLTLFVVVVVFVVVVSVFVVVVSVFVVVVVSVFVVVVVEFDRMFSSLCEMTAACASWPRQTQANRSGR